MSELLSTRTLIRHLLIGLAALLLITVLLVSGLVSFSPVSIYRRSNPEISDYLRSQTPLGSSREQVRDWLVARRGDHRFDRADGTMKAIVAEYGWFFTVVVAATYEFDNSGGLQAIKVEHETIAP